MLEIVFLGTGSGIPTPKRNHPSIWFRYEDKNWLWDCGEGTQRQLFNARINFMKIDRIFITHWHADHWAGLIGLIQTMNLEKRNRTLSVYGPDAERFVGDILDLDYWGPRFQIKGIDVPYEGGEATVLYKTGSFEISSIPVDHTVPAVAYCFREKESWNVSLEKAAKYGLKQGPLIGKLKDEGEITFKGKEIKLEDVAVSKPVLKVVYSGDTKICDNVEKISKDATLLIHEATFLNENEKKRLHTGADEAAKLAHRANVSRLILTHFSRRYTDIRQMLSESRRYFRNTDLAEDFMHISLKPDA